MSDDIASEVRRRNDQAVAGSILDAVSASLKSALRQLATDRGAEWLDVFLAQRLEIVASMRVVRPHEPAALAAVRERDASAIETTLREIVEAVRHDFRSES